MRALIFAGQLVEISPVDFPVAPPLVWVAAPVGATVETHFYNGVAVVLRPPKTQAELNAEQSAVARQKLAALDLASIRTIREWVVLQPSAPQSIKDQNAAAVLERGKIT